MAVLEAGHRRRPLRNRPDSDAISPAAWAGLRKRRRQMRPDLTTKSPDTQAGPRKRPRRSRPAFPTKSREGQASPWRPGGGCRWWCWGVRYLEGPVLVASYLRTAAPTSIIGKQDGGFGSGPSRTAPPERTRFRGNMARYTSGPPKAAAPEEPGSYDEIARNSSGPPQTAAPEQAGFPYRVT